MRIYLFEILAHSKIGGKGKSNELINLASVCVALYMRVFRFPVKTQDPFLLLEHLVYNLLDHLHLIK